GAIVEVQSLHLHAAERATWNHALNSLLKHALREAAVENLSSGDALDTAGIAGVTVVGLFVALLAGEHHLVGVDDDNMVTAVNVRGVAWLVLAAQNVGDDRSHAADHQTFGIDQMPILVDLGRLNRPGLLAERLHGLSHP